MEILVGDFCYVMWFDNKLDAKYFFNLLEKRGILTWYLHTRYTNEYTVIWDIGVHI